jgi:hypothetical protein
MPKTSYTAEDIERGLQALAECGGNASMAAEKTGIPRGTLRYWAANKFADEFATIRQEKRTDLIDKVWGMAGEALGQTRKKLKKASANQAAVIFAIMVDKALLLGGEPTEITKQLPQIVFRGVDESEYEDREQE